MESTKQRAEEESCWVDGEEERFEGCREEWGAGGRIQFGGCFFDRGVAVGGYRDVDCDLGGGAAGRHGDAREVAAGGRPKDYS